MGGSDGFHAAVAAAAAAAAAALVFDVDSALRVFQHESDLPDIGRTKVRQRGSVS